MNYTKQTQAIDLAMTAAVENIAASGSPVLSTADKLTAAHHDLCFAVNAAARSAVLSVYGLNAVVDVISIAEDTDLSLPYPFRMSLI